ncbi:MAG: metalloregulator ArsR/SmtB family transcription factor [Patescibacteria group bacterium]|nr:metalloregulator ArsR/SmtB family transcription factor [Patescibacteria group bacterium]
MKIKQKDTLLNMFKTLSEIARLDIVLLLTSGEKCVCEIFKNLKLPQNLVSHHLRILRQSGLIINRKQGKWVHYSLNRKNIKELQKLLTKIGTAKEKPPKY